MDLAYLEAYFLISAPYGISNSEMKIRNKRKLSLPFSVEVRRRKVRYGGQCNRCKECLPARSSYSLSSIHCQHHSLFSPFFMGDCKQVLLIPSLLAPTPYSVFLAFLSFCIQKEMKICDCLVCAERAPEGQKNRRTTHSQRKRSTEVASVSFT